MADHGTIEYATATGNDYPAHVGTYERFILFTFVGIIHVINLLLGLTVGGVMGHWFVALPIFIIAIIGGVSGLLSGGSVLEERGPDLAVGEPAAGHRGAIHGGHLGRGGPPLRPPFREARCALTAGLQSLGSPAALRSRARPH